ncbi:DUF4416 family protein [Candidatus Poribacteria bacterium]|nr:DUF4416 family protein [Candidatus Poribacteria bacterium]
MGEIKKHPPVKFITGMISVDKSLFELLQEILSHKFGGIDFQSEVIKFDFTDYYYEEMGSELLRKFISFERLIMPEELVEIKHYTNDIEKGYLQPDSERRRINLDPGYVSAAKLILASTKDHIHRIYLNNGIYAETTLRRENKSFRPWQWTYPDYRSEKYIEIFNKIRRIYMKQLKDQGISAHPISIVSQ